MRYHIDTHVHVYHCYSAEEFLSQAIINSDRVSPDAGLILCLTESQGFNFFSRLRQHLQEQTSIKGWTVSAVNKGPAIQLAKSGRSILILAGKQIITKQGLEVLALFDESDYQDGKDIQIVIDEINQNDGLAVLPWGVGKWLGQRGKFIQDLLESNDPKTLAIADISGRPAIWPEPAQFKLARKLGYSCLYGTDPLPLSYDQKRIASAGLAMDLPDQPNMAVSELRSNMLCKEKISFYGKRVSPVAFFKDQLMLRIARKTCLSEENQNG